MKLIASRDAQRLTGLSADQLREWTTRRGLILPDKRPSGSGSRTMYSWQTILALRLAVVLKSVFHVELESQRTSLAKLSQLLRRSSFLSLRGKIVFLRSDGRLQIGGISSIGPARCDGIVLLLDPHLEQLALLLAGSELVRQLPLFPALAVK